MAKIDTSYDPVTGIIETYHLNGDGKLVVEHGFDLEPTKRANKALFNERDNKWKGDANHHIASIPLPVYFQLKRRIGNDKKAFLKWLEDPDNRVFKTKPGRLA